MYQYIFCVLLLMLSGLRGASIDKQANQNSLKETESEDECIQEYSCANCTSVKICRREYNGPLKKVNEFNCAKDNPFCDPESGTCGKSSPNVECNTVSYDFVCPSEGYFPDPLDCRKYYVCVKGVAYVGDCGISYYNAKSENCQYTYICPTINCRGKSGIKVAYANNKSFFGYCFNNTLISFNKCPGQFELDENKQKCVPVCYREGLQGDPYDCSKYYKCYYQISPIFFTLSHFKCPSGELFDSLNFRCIPKKDGMTCTSGQGYTSDEKFVYIPNIISKTIEPEHVNLNIKNQ